MINRVKLFCSPSSSSSHSLIPALFITFLPPLIQFTARERGKRDRERERESCAREKERERGRERKRERKMT
jgi:hypothetical protein